MRKLTKMIPLALLSCLIVVIHAAATFAYSVDSKGSLTIDFKTSDTEVGIPGAEFTLYKIADLNANGSFTPYTSDLDVYKKDGESNEDLIYRLSEAATTYYKTSAGTVLEGRTSSSGSLVFSDVPYGAYIGINTDPAAGYTESEAFLVSIPTTINGDNYITDITVSPKPVEKPVITPSIITNTPIPVKTGDDSMILPYLILGMAAGVCITWVVKSHVKFKKSVTVFYGRQEEKGGTQK